MRYPILTKLRASAKDMPGVLDLIDRIQDQLVAAITPMLGNTLFAMARWRIAQDSAGRFAVQYLRTPPNTWTTIATLSSTATGFGAASPLTTKGDVWGYSTLDARVPVGSNTQVLTADSTQALGVKWAAPSAAGQVEYGATRRWGSHHPGQIGSNQMLVAGLVGGGGVGNAGNTALGNRNCLFWGSTGAGTTAGFSAGTSETRPLYLPRLKVCYLHDATAGTISRLWVGLSSESIAAVAGLAGGSAASVIHFVCIGWDSAVSANYLLMSGDGTNYSGIDTGVAVDVSKQVRVTIDWTNNALLSALVESSPYTAGGTFSTVYSGTKATNLSTGAIGLGIYAARTQLLGGAVYFYYSSIMLEQNP